jgi:hypothetical protein
LSVLSAASYAGAAVAQERLAENRHRGLGRWWQSIRKIGDPVSGLPRRPPGYYT